jgi:PPOX class probable F420-dependent enzyme
MPFTLSPATIELLNGRNYAVLATLNPDGSPHTSAMWVGRDGDDVLMSTVAGRRKHRNMVLDPRISVTIMDATDGENYVELRGRVTVTPDTGLVVDNQLSWKYDGKDKDPDPPGTERVVVRLTVAKATGRAA